MNHLIKIAIILGACGVGLAVGVLARSKKKYDDVPIVNELPPAVPEASAAPDIADLTPEKPKAPEPRRAEAKKDAVTHGSVRIRVQRVWVERNYRSAAVHQPTDVPLLKILVQLENLDPKRTVPFRYTNQIAESSFLTDERGKRYTGSSWNYTPTLTLKHGAALTDTLYFSAPDSLPSYLNLDFVPMFTKERPVYRFRIPGSAIEGLR